MKKLKRIFICVLSVALTHAKMNLMKMSVKNKYENYNENFVNINEKEKLINRVIKASEKYDATASVAKDYSYFLNKYKNEKEYYKTNITILSLLSDSIKSGNVFEISSIDEMLGNFELNDDIKELISNIEHAKQSKKRPFKGLLNPNVND